MNVSNILYFEVMNVVHSNLITKNSSGQQGKSSKVADEKI